jgi:hypothetical protein
LAVGAGVGGVVGVVGVVSPLEGVGAIVGSGVGGDVGVTVQNIISGYKINITCGYIIIRSKCYIC